MKDAMMRYAAGVLAIGLTFGSSACVVFVDGEEDGAGCESTSTHEGDDGDRYANWGWHGDDCPPIDWGDDDDWHDWDNNDSDAGGGDDHGGDGDGSGGGDQGGGDGGGDGQGGADGGGGEDCPETGEVCGEDGQTYETACEASRAHVRVVSSGPCLPPCAEDLDCADGSLCEAGSCHEVTCPELAEDDHSQEVCAEDGFTYQTECEARMARLGVAHEGCCVE